MTSKPSQGVSLIELLIILAIIGIIAGIAVPSYQNHTRRAYYSELVNATSPYKVAVSACVVSKNTLTGCDAGTNNIPFAINTPTGVVASINVRRGVITATPVAQYGLVGTDTYILTPVLDPNSGTITWLVTGGGVTKGYAQ